MVFHGIQKEIRDHLHLNPLKLCGPPKHLFLKKHSMKNIIADFKRRARWNPRSRMFCFLPKVKSKEYSVNNSTSNL